MLRTASRNFFTVLTLTTSLIGLTPLRAEAWGSSGHHLIAVIAGENLNKTARLEVEKLLLKDDFVSVSTYADEIRLYRPETTRWHFVEFPQNATAYVSSRDCIETAQGDCMVAAIQRSIRSLKSDKGDFEQKSEALKFLIHLVGDLHQPLHCAYKDDRGGNTIRVYFPMIGMVTNLHSAWDSSMIERAMIPYKQNETEYKLYLRKTYGGTFVREVNAKMKTDKTPEEWISDWAFESYCVAVNSAYNVHNQPTTRGGCWAEGAVRRPLLRLTTTQHHAVLNFLDPQKAPSKPVDISGKYYQLNLPVLEQQLVKAGLRLAGILNRIYPETR